MSTKKEGTSTMSQLKFSPKKLAELDVILPGLREVWKEVKARMDFTIRCPHLVVLTDEPGPTYLNDGECGTRFALDLVTMKMSDKLHHVSSGEWAVHAGSNNDEAVKGVPNRMAVVNVAIQEYYRTARIYIQVAPGALPSQLPQ